MGISWWLLVSSLLALSLAIRVGNDNVPHVDDIIVDGVSVKTRFDEISFGTFCQHNDITLTKNMIGHLTFDVSDLSAVDPTGLHIRTRSNSVVENWNSFDLTAAHLLAGSVEVPVKGARSTTYKLCQSNTCCAATATPSHTLVSKVMQAEGPATLGVWPFAIPDQPSYEVWFQRGDAEVTGILGSGREVGYHPFVARLSGESDLHFWDCIHSTTSASVGDHKVRGKFFHFMAVQTPAKLIFYLNGERVASLSGKTYSGDNSAFYVPGYNSNAIGQAATDSLYRASEGTQYILARMYNTTLTDAEVVQKFVQGPSEDSSSFIECLFYNELGCHIRPSGTSVTIDKMIQTEAPVTLTDRQF